MVKEGKKHTKGRGESGLYIASSSIILVVSVSPWNSWRIRRCHDISMRMTNIHDDE